MPASEIQKWIPVLQELWLTAACKVLAEISGSPFEVDATSETETRRPLGVCSEFQISGDLQGKVAFGIPAASREMSEVLLPGGDGEGDAKPWEDFSKKTARQWLELLQAETGLVCTTKAVHRDPDFGIQPDAEAGLFSTLKSDKVTLPVYLLTEVHEPAVGTRLDPEKDALGQNSSSDPHGGDNAANLDLLLDIELQASLRFGGREMLLSEILEMGPGDVVPLDRPVHAPVDLVVGDRIVARGEVVLVDGNYGLRVTEVAEPRKRLETVRCLF